MLMSSKVFCPQYKDKEKLKPENVEKKNGI